MSKLILGNNNGVELCLSWRPTAGGEIPEGALDAGGECYVIRAQHNGYWVPGKLLRGQCAATISFGGSEFAVPQYEVLVRSGIGSFGAGYDWVRVEDGNFPERALVAGSNGSKPVLVARGKYGGRMCTGRAFFGHKRAYIGWNGEETALDDFEVLVFTCNTK